MRRLPGGSGADVLLSLPAPGLDFFPFGQHRVFFSGFNPRIDGSRLLAVAAWKNGKHVCGDVLGAEHLLTSGRRIVLHHGPAEDKREQPMLRLSSCLLVLLTNTLAAADVSFRAPPTVVKTGDRT